MANCLRWAHASTVTIKMCRNYPFRQSREKLGMCQPLYGVSALVEMVLAAAGLSLIHI